MELPRIAIPSYGRAHSIAKKTLKFLKQQEYPRELINVFVADSKEYLDYDNELDEDLYGEIIIGVKGLKEQRGFISDFYHEDEIIVQMDDDVMGVKSDVGFKTLVEMGVNALYGRTAGLWGIMPNDDRRRFKDKTTSHLAHILGSFFVIRNTKMPWAKLTITEKEDMERSILYFNHYGKVLRYCNAGVITTYRKGTGGLNTEGRLDRMKSDLEWLRETYPQNCTTVNKKGIQDIVLKWRQK